jgi:hypothetical protein
VAQSGDLVFLDCPYPETMGYSTAFTMQDWSEMYLWVRDAIPRGIAVIVTNPHTLSLLWNLILPHACQAFVKGRFGTSKDRREYIGSTLPPVEIP